MARTSHLDLTTSRLTEQREARRIEREQVERACDGDHLAFREIVERHQRGLYALCLRMVGNRSEAEDLLQEAFTKAYAKLDTFDPAYRLSTWLYRVTLNVCRDYLKSPRRNERPTEDVAAGVVRHEPEDRADGKLLEAERCDIVHEAIAQLRSSYREIIVLKDLQGLSYREISEATGVPVTALKIRAVRARARLRELLEAS